MMNIGNHPQMAARFRLVKNYNLPRCMVTPPPGPTLGGICSIFIKKEHGFIVQLFVCFIYYHFFGCLVPWINPNYIIQTNLIHFASKTFLLKNPWGCAILLFRREAFRDVKLYFWWGKHFLQIKGVPAPVERSWSSLKGVLHSPKEMVDWKDRYIFQNIV